MPVRWLFGIATALLVLSPSSVPFALADEVAADFTAQKTASASIQITLTIPPRAQVRTDPSGVRALCLSHIPASFLQVGWTGSETGRSANTRTRLASLTGNPLVRDCISLDTDPPGKSDLGYLLISAE
ncbi:hypothetical protein [Microbulbifer sp. YPW1]|uniref:hypothetical protein n=1 Tax=Microbulbifer sp. YPW1 TaxID=2745199 RepID=UPI001599C6FE|nr:hypothetical protein [Microbulbifer sp. YPW1]QKX15845.1 hypothetical protein HUW35_01850 [Microbulbifer sp. YPW1]